MLELRAKRFALLKGFTLGMDMARLLTFTTIAGFAAMTLHPGTAFAMAPMLKTIASSATESPITQAQYEGIPQRKPGGPAWYEGPGRRGEWQGGPEWHQSWPSSWGGGWYGGWYQPYWGQGAWASPYWYYGHPDYYGGSPGLCSGVNCWQPLK